MGTAWTADPWVLYWHEQNVISMENTMFTWMGKIRAEHLKYCGPIATAAITWLINSKTRIKITPRYIKKGLILPIPKSNKDCTIRDNNNAFAYILQTVWNYVRERIWVAETTANDTRPARCWSVTLPNLAHVTIGARSYRVQCKYKSKCICWEAEH